MIKRSWLGCLLVSFEHVCLLSVTVALFLKMRVWSHHQPLNMVLMKTAHLSSLPVSVRVATCLSTLLNCGFIPEDKSVQSPSASPHGAYSPAQLSAHTDAKHLSGQYGYFIYFSSNVMMNKELSYTVARLHVADSSSSSVSGQSFPWCWKWSEGNMTTLTPTHPQRDIISQILRDNYDSLFRIVSIYPSGIASSLYSQLLIDEGTLNYVTSAVGVSDHDKAHKLVQKCTHSILIHQHPVGRLRKLLDILTGTQPAARPVVDRILEKVT